MPTYRAVVCLLALVWASAATPALGGAPATVPLDRADQHLAGLELIQRHVFAALRPADQALLRALGEAPEGALAQPQPANLPPSSDADYAAVAPVLSRAAFDALMPVHRTMVSMVIQRRLEGRPVPAFSFAPETEPEIVRAFERAVFAPIGLRFQNAARWTTTATNTTPTNQGDRVTLRYSFVPDGTLVPSFSPDGGLSDLFSYLNGIYGNPLTWQRLYGQVLNRWGALCGVTYVFEPNDDGIPIGFPDSSGAIAVRGDLRFAGTPLDGPSNVLAFNFFPDANEGGDMVIDTSDTFYFDTSNANLRLRNVLAHEHGHGLGFAHVCPNNQTKLMEPFVSTAYDGPQLDDILNSQRGYGDISEPNDSATNPTLLLPPTTTPVTLANRSLDGLGDIDNYLVTIPANTILRVTIQPPGSPYAENFQSAGGTAGCIALGTSYNPATARTLTLRFFQGTSTTLLASATAAPGNPITLNLASTPSASLSVRIEVSSADGLDAIQAYALSYSSSGPGSAVSLAAPLPAALTSVPTPITVSATSTGAITSVILAYRLSPTAGFDAASMSLVGPALYRATLPAAVCLSSPEYYIIVNGAGSASLPPDAPLTTFRADAPRERILVFSDSFEPDFGWTYGAPGDAATTGIWARGTPIGSLAQPNAAFSGTNCAFTGNAGSTSDPAGINDVDSGFTSLISPPMNLFNLRDVRINYARWYSNQSTGLPGINPFRVDISNNNGATWTPLEVVPATGPGNAGGWILASLPLPSGFVVSNQVRVRFQADDTGPGSIVEAAVDDFSATGSLTADFNASGAIDVNDIFAFLSGWFARQPNTDFNRSGATDVNDIFAFLAVWFTRC